MNQKFLCLITSVLFSGISADAVAWTLASDGQSISTDEGVSFVCDGNGDLHLEVAPAMAAPDPATGAVVSLALATAEGYGLAEAAMVRNANGAGSIPIDDRTWLRKHLATTDPMSVLGDGVTGETLLPFDAIGYADLLKIVDSCGAPVGGGIRPEDVPTPDLVYGLSSFELGMYHRITELPRCDVTGDIPVCRSVAGREAINRLIGAAIEAVARRPPNTMDGDVRLGDASGTTPTKELRVCGQDEVCMIERLDHITALWEAKFRPDPPPDRVATIVPAEPPRMRTAPIGLPNTADRQLESDATIAAEEARFAADAASRGLVYRSPDFWVRFSEPGYLRFLFNGNGATQVRSEYFDGFPMSLDLRLFRDYAYAFAVAQGEVCSDVMPPFASELVESTTTTDLNTGAQSTAENRRVLVHPAYEAGLRAVMAYDDSVLGKLDEVSPAFGMVQDLMAAADQNPLAAFQWALGVVADEYRPLLDMRTFVAVAGCDTPTTRQMMENLARIAVSAPVLQVAGIGIEGAIQDSDLVPTVGQRNSVAEACWAGSLYDAADVPYCNCVDSALNPLVPLEGATFAYADLYRWTRKIENLEGLGSAELSALRSAATCDSLRQ
jgi:hypothetical protein